MKFQNICVISAPAQKLWDYLTDIPAVARCLPGVEDIRVKEVGVYTGFISIKIGMVKLRLAGDITIELMDANRRLATMKVQATDQRISGLIQGQLSMNLEEISPQETKLLVDTNVNLFGKIGEFGQPMIKRKADQMMDEFAANVADMVAPDSTRKKVQIHSVLGLSEDTSS